MYSENFAPFGLSAWTAWTADKSFCALLHGLLLHNPLSRSFPTSVRAPHRRSPRLPDDSTADFHQRRVRARDTFADCCVVRCVFFNPAKERRGKSIHKDELFPHGTTSGRARSEIFGSWRFSDLGIELTAAVAAMFTHRLSSASSVNTAATTNGSTTGPISRLGCCLSSWFRQHISHH